MADIISDYKICFETPEGNTNTAVGMEGNFRKDLKEAFFWQWTAQFTVDGIEH
jgi:hypothetical protein